MTYRPKDTDEGFCCVAWLLGLCVEKGGLRDARDRENRACHISKMILYPSKKGLYVPSPFRGVCFIPL